MNPENNPPQAMPPPPQNTMPISHNTLPPAQETSNEELIEAIIDEKWNELVKDISKIIEWKNNAQNQLAQFEQKFQDLQAQFDRLHNAVVGKIGEYDKHILDVGAEIQSMEKVFSKILPVFTQNVSELTRITDDLKSKKK